LKSTERARPSPRLVGSDNGRSSNAFKPFGDS
jgi:hypothetical protein